MTADSTFATGLFIVGAAILLYLFWTFSRKVVKWGFFTFYFLLGAAITWLLNPRFDASLPIGAGIAFAWAVMAIKAKVWKAVTGIAVLAALSLVLPSFVGKDQDKTEKKSTHVARQNRPR